MGATATAVLTAFALKVLGALVLWFVGRWLIGFVVRLLGNALERQSLDRTLSRYLQTSLRVLLNIVLVVALLGFFGFSCGTISIASACE